MNFKKILLSSLLALLSLNAFGVTCTSNGDGSWSDKGKWNCDGSDHVPTADDDVIIRRQDSITLDIDATIKSLTLNRNKSSAKLIITNNNSLNVSNDIINNGTIKASSRGTSFNIDVGGSFLNNTYGELLTGWATGTTNINVVGDFINRGDVQIYQNGSFTVGGLFTNDNSVDFQNGNLNFTVTSLTNNNILNLRYNFGTFIVNQDLINNAGDTITLSQNARLNNLYVKGTFTNNGNVIIAEGTANTGSSGLASNASEIKINNLINNATGAFSVGASPNLIFYGNVTNNNTNLNLGRAYVYFGGTGQQSVIGLSRVYSLAINNSEGILLNSNLLVGFNSGETGQLYLLRGRVFTNSNASLGYTTSCERSMHLVRNAGSWVQGNFSLTFPTYSVTCTALVGDEKNYSPVTIQSNSWPAPQAGNVIVNITRGDHVDTMAGQSWVDANKSVNKYIELSSSTPNLFSSSKYNLTVNYCDGVSGADCTETDLDSGVTVGNIIGGFYTTAWAKQTPASRSTTGTMKNIVFNNLSSLGTLVLGEEKAPLVLTCNGDDFSGDLSKWRVSGNYTPTIVTANSEKRLRLTDSAGNRATFAQFLRYFPAAGNKLVVEFNYYVYGGSGADGITVTLSDANVVPSPGAYGGSLGYANGHGTNGFNGGWLSIGIDEYGNFPNPTEDRRGYPTGWIAPAPANKAAGFYPNNISVRGSGSGTNGYYLLANTGTISPVIWNRANTVSSVQKYRITFDHSNNVNAYLTIERAVGTTGTYSTIVPKFDVKGANSQQAAVPERFQISFTGSTGGSTNIHEIRQLNACSYYMIDPTSSNNASSFDCLETGVNIPWNKTARKPLYTKLVGTNFSFDVAALKSDGSLESEFVGALGSPKNVLVELFDATTPKACASYTLPIASQTVTYTSTTYSGERGRINTANFNITRPYSKVIARVRDTNSGATIYGCSSDTFTIKPLDLTVSSSANADNAGLSTTATPKIKAGDNFNIFATSTIGYTGTPQINNSLMEWPNHPAWGVADAQNGVGILSGNFSAANPTTGVATGTFNYSEAGYFRFKVGGVFDNSLTAASSDQVNGDCIVNSASNVLVGGKYGCNVQNNTITNYFGRFIPFGYTITGNNLINRSDLVGVSNFTYLDEPFKIMLNLTPVNSSGGTVLNYNRTNFNPSAASNWLLDTTNGMSSRLQMDSATASWNSSGVLNAVLNFKINRATNPDGPFNGLKILANPTDLDGVSLITSNLDYDSNADSVNDKKILGESNFYFGRLKISNYSGSELLQSPIALEMQYYNNYGFVTNTNDNLTSLNPSLFTKTNFTGNLTSSVLSYVYPGTFINGKQTLLINKPTGGSGLYNGSFNLGYNLAGDNKSYLLGKWSSSTYTDNPNSLITLSRQNVKKKNIFFGQNF